MKSNSNFIKYGSISTVVILISIIFLIFLRSLPVSKIWNSYTVAYVEKSVPEETVLSFFHENGVQHVVSFSGQTVPFSSTVTPVVPQGENSYLVKRMNYFSDKANHFNLYYIPQNYERNAAKALNQINQAAGNKVQSGMDGKKQFPWLVFVICFAVYVTYIILSSNKLSFAAAGFFPLMLTLSLPFYPVASAVILFFLAFYLGQRIWDRKNFLPVLLKNMYFLTFSISGFLILFCFSWKSAVLGILCILSSLSLLYLLKSFENYLETKSSFSYVKIFTAKQLPVMYYRKAWHLLFTSVPMALLASLFLFSARFTPVSASRSLMLPSPVDKKTDFVEEDQLPVLNDFYSWTFNVDSFPYRNLNLEDFEVPVAENEKIILKRFESGEKGIRVFEEEILTFNDAYKNSVDKKIELLDGESLEKFLKKQGRNINVAYSSKASSKASHQNDYLSLILLIAGILIPAVMSIIYFIFGRRRV